MDNIYRASFSGSPYKEEYKSISVAYLTLISTLADTRTDTANNIHPLLQSWKESCMENGYPTDKLIASVEICGQGGGLQRVYFPIPSYVIEYWPYPETQKSKESILWSVNRESADEKIADFFDRLGGLSRVMGRQEKMRVILTPVFHLVLGGKRPPFTGFLKYFPIRSVLLAYTVILNIYQCYLIYRKAYGWVPSSYYGYFEKWEYYDLALTVAYTTHSGLSFLVALRDLLNSPAADEIPENSISPLISALQGFIAVLMDCWWSLLMLGLSVLALFFDKLWYSLCLLEIVPQFKMMLFLVESVYRNLTKICFAILMALILLYLFAVADFQFMRNQYDFGGHQSCDDLASCFKLHVDFGLNQAPSWHGTH